MCPVSFLIYRFGSSMPTGRCSPLWRSDCSETIFACEESRQDVVVFCWRAWKSLGMPAPRDNHGVQWIPLSSEDSHTQTESEPDTETEPCAEELPREIDNRPAGDSLIQGRFPADTPITPVIGVSHRQFCDKVKGSILPGDGNGRESFDTFPTFVVGDPDARFDHHTPLTYETTGEVGHPIWKDIFGYILSSCSYLTAFDTVYVMVDTRNLTAHGTAQDGLPHWPAAAAAWWHSRLQLIGPNQEKTELLFLPACEQTGLHRVYPTWAGTFALAALVAMFPGTNFILLE